MYETYFGFAEKPFSLTPDPKYLYRSPSHANAFDLLQYAIHRREGFVVITGDIGTGKTTLCRALLEQIDRTTFSALVLNPFLSEDDLLKRILQDFGIVSRDDVKGERLARVSKQELIDALYDFLLGLIPLKAGAVLIIDEAQNLPLQVLEQIRILSNLETDKEKLLQIILVGQPELQTMLRSAELRQLDQRVSIRYELKPLDREAVGAYVAHRLTIAGGSSAVTFNAKSLDCVHKLSGGIPRLINLICDRALLAAFSMRTNRIVPKMVKHAAQSLDIQPASPGSGWGWMRRRRGLLGTTAAVIALSAAGGSLVVYRRLEPLLVTVNGSAPHIGIAPVPAAPEPSPSDPALAPGATDPAVPDPAVRQLPPDASVTILVGSYQVSGPPALQDASLQQIHALTDWLESSGFKVYYANVDLGARGQWQRILAGAYNDADSARADVERLKKTRNGAEARVVTTTYVTGVASASPRDGSRRSSGGGEP